MQALELQPAWHKQAMRACQQGTTSAAPPPTHTLNIWLMASKAALVEMVMVGSQQPLPEAPLPPTTMGRELLPLPPSPPPRPKLSVGSA